MLRWGTGNIRLDHVRNVDIRCARWFKIRFIWDYNIVSHEYNTRIVYKVTLQVNKYRRLKQRLTCTRCAVRNTT